MITAKNIFALISLILLSLFFISCGGESTVIYMAPTIQNSEELTKLRTREKTALTSYKLIDAEQGIYQIPVDSAIKILLDTKFYK